jgi:spore coat polysaccharide biosynthesis protein SpsF (cytidylyltransferase family)
MFSFFKKKTKEYTKIEGHILGIIIELLKLSSTDINCDELGGKYYLSNEEQHFRVTIFSNENVIRMTNTRDSVSEKYDKNFVEDVLKAVKQEKHRRMELVCDSITSSIEKMAERLHNTLVNGSENERKTIKLMGSSQYSKNKKVN